MLFKILRYQYYDETIGFMQFPRDPQLGGESAGTSRAFYFLQFDQCKSENWSWNIFLP